MSLNSWQAISIVRQSLHAGEGRLEVTSPLPMDVATLQSIVGTLRDPRICSSDSRSGESSLTDATVAA